MREIGLRLGQSFYFDDSKIISYLRQKVNNIVTEVDYNFRFRLLIVHKYIIHFINPKSTYILIRNFRTNCRRCITADCNDGEALI